MTELKALVVEPGDLTAPTVLAQIRELAESGTARRVRLAAGVPLATVGRACGVSRQLVSFWETGQRRVSASEAGLRYAEVMVRMIQLVEELNRTTPQRP
jgi:hypothetical protein